MIKAQTIMMVDDEQSVLDRFEKYFTSKGYHFIPLNNPKSIIKSINTHKPNIILMDIALNDMRGDKIIRLLREKGLKKPIIVVSGYINKNLIVGLKDYDVTDFFAKPVSLEKLEMKIQDLMTQKKKIIPSKTSKRPLEKDPYTQNSILLITENKSIIINPLSFIPQEVIEKHGLKIIVKTGLHDSINALKKSSNNVQMITIDAANEAKVLVLTKLLKIVTANIQIAVYFIANGFSQKLKDSLFELGFENLITRGDYSPVKYIEMLSFALTNIQVPSPKKKTKSRLTIIKDLKAIKTLPPLPDIFIKIEQLSHNPKATSTDYGNVLELDPNITARILRMSNSALYSFKRKIKTVKDAVTLMGTREILSLVRLACITGNLKSSPEIESAIRGIWEHSACCAVTAKLLYKKMDIWKTENLEDDLFICGIIHDIGKIIIWKFFTEAYINFSLNPDVSPYPLESEEEANLGISHSEVGKELANYWGIPDMLTDVIGFHHKPMLMPESELVMIIHISDYISKNIMQDKSNGQEYEIDTEFLKKINYSVDQIQELTEELKPEIENNTKLLTKLITS